MKPAVAICCLVLASAGGLKCHGFVLKDDGYHVFPGENIQTAIEAAAGGTNKVVKVHAGEYRPQNRGPALIWFNRSHEGVQLEAVGEVTLTAANAALSDASSPSHPATVNHVVYFGDGITGRTRLKGFRITGANHFITTNLSERIEPGDSLPKGLFFHADGGAIKIFGRSFPTIDSVEIVDNYASPCAGGLSVEQGGGASAGDGNMVVIENCVFRNNRSQVTGAAIDLLPGSAARVVNCLFVGNAANNGRNYISSNPLNPEFANSSPLTVFPGSRAIVRNCTFTNNRNGVDDWGSGSVYRDCIFWRNTLAGGYYSAERYEFDLEGRAEVSGCFLGGRLIDPARLISNAKNVLQPPAPDFDASFAARAREYTNAGYRPVRVGNDSPAGR